MLGALFVIQAAVPGSSLWAHSTLQFSVPFLSLSLGLNIILNGMLVGRLLYIRQKVIQSLPSHYGESYTTIVAMTLESATPYGIISFVFLVPYALGNSAAFLFLPIYVQIQVHSINNLIGDIMTDIGSVILIFSVYHPYSSLCVLLVAEYCPMKQSLILLKFNLQTREFPIICQLCYQFIIHHSICVQASII